MIGVNMNRGPILSFSQYDTELVSEDIRLSMTSIILIAVSYTHLTLPTKA